MSDDLKDNAPPVSLSTTCSARRAFWRYYWNTDERTGEKTTVGAVGFNGRVWTRFADESEPRFQMGMPRTEYVPCGQWISIDVPLGFGPCGARGRHKWPKEAKADIWEDFLEAREFFRQNVQSGGSASYDE